MVVGIPIRPYEFVQNRVSPVVKSKELGNPARLLAHIPGRQAEKVIETKFMVLKTGFVEREKGAGLSTAALICADKGGN